MGNFKDAISGKGHIAVIAEIKRRSPSYGDFPVHSVTELAAAYERGGAAAISVVTEPMMFGGSLELLKQMRLATKLPILRKDFISKLFDVEESARAGADAVLLIASLLTARELRDFSEAAQKAGMDALVEIHDEQDLAKTIDLKHAMIGINNRNLRTFATDVHHAEKFVSRIAPSRTIVVESAFAQAEDLVPYRGRADAALIGTALLTAPNPQNALTAFTAVP